MKKINLFIALIAIIGGTVIQQTAIAGGKGYICDGETSRACNIGDIKHYGKLIKLEEIDTSMP